MNTALQFLMYTTSDSRVNVNAVENNDTIYRTHKGIAKLFGVNNLAINKHLKNIFSVRELSPNTTAFKKETVVNRGFRGDVFSL